MNKIIGHSNPICDAKLKVTGKMKYVGDMKFSNMLYAKIKYSDIPHGIIISINTEKAEKLKGVRKILTAFNTPEIKYNSALRFFEHNIPETETVFSKVVRFIGDRVAAVVAESEDIAEKAISLIEIKYKELPHILSIEESLDNKILLHNHSNIVGEINSSCGDVDEAFSRSDFIFQDSYKVPAVHHGAIETHSVIADYNYNDKLTIYTPTQNIFGFRILLSKILQKPLHKIRVIRPSIGGSFGGKLELTIEPIAALLSKEVRQPVKLVLSRKESIISTRTRHEAEIKIKTGVNKKGEILGQDIELYLNTGAYAGSAMNVLGALSHKIYKVYKTKNMKFKGASIYTNLPIAGAMRGYGSPQVFFAQQMQMTKISKALNIPIDQLQLINVVDPHGIDQRFNSKIGNPQLIECINKAKKLMNYNKDNDDYHVGIGMSIGAHGNGVFGAHRDVMSLLLKVNEDGSLTLITGVHDMGNGSATMQKQIVGEVLELNIENIETLEGDTDACLWNLGAYASRGVFVEGGAAKHIAEKLKIKLLNIAELILETKDLTYLNGIISDKKGKSITISDIAIYSQNTLKEELTIKADYSSPTGATSYGVHIAKVGVHKNTKHIKVLEYVAVHDVGKVINPISIEGQLEGGIQMGIGYALKENLRHNANGKILTDGFNNYHIPKMEDMPICKLEFIEKEENGGPFGAKSIGECAVVPVGAAIASAVEDAINIEIKQLPINL